jgi:hypothetical protein
MILIIIIGGGPANTASLFELMKTIGELKRAGLGRPDSRIGAPPSFTTGLPDQGQRSGIERAPCWPSDLGQSARSRSVVGNGNHLKL